MTGGAGTPGLEFTPTTRLTITNSGNVGIGTTSPNVALDVIGDIEYTGTITDVSDIRLKAGVEDLPAALAKLAQLRPVSFRMKGDDKAQTELGLIAQELEKVYPELVRTADDELGTKSVNYVGLIVPLIKATQELKANNDSLRAENDRLAQRLRAVKPSGHAFLPAPTAGLRGAAAAGTAGPMRVRTREASGGAGLISVPRASGIGAPWPAKSYASTGWGTDPALAGLVQARQRASRRPAQFTAAVGCCSTAAQPFCGGYDRCVRERRPPTAANRR